MSRVDGRPGSGTAADEAPRVLVTAATGRVGSGVVHCLGSAPVTVRIATRDPDGARETFEDGPEYVAFDLDRPETWGQTLDGVDRLFLLYPPGVSVGRIRAFVDAAIRVGVERVVFLSILGAEKVPVLPHRRIERHVAGSGVEHAFLRAAYFMQNLSGIHSPEIRACDEILVPAGSGKLGFVDSRDVSAVAAKVLVEDGHENRAYDLTGGTAMDFHEVATVMSDVLGRPITYADPSRTAFACRTFRRGVPPSMIAFMLAEYQVTRLGLSSRTTDDVERILGREPLTLRKFATDYRAAFEAD